MNRADRELLADLARMNSDVAPLGLRIMEDSATFDEQQAFAHRLIELGTRLHDRAHQTELVIDGHIVEDSGQSPESSRPSPSGSLEKGSLCS